MDENNLAMQQTTGILYYAGNTENWWWWRTLWKLIFLYNKFNSKIKKIIIKKCIYNYIIIL